MEAPDRIYINGFSAFATEPVKDGIEYIRKDALIEWLKANLQDRDNWNEKSAADALLDNPRMRHAVQNHSEQEYYEKVLKEYRKEATQKKAP